jgi:flagellar hook-associated protein 2
LDEPARRPLASDHQPKGQAMAGAITFGGLGSGLDTGAIIDALVKAEQAPIDKLTAQKTDFQKKIDLIGTFKGLVETLRTKASALGTLSGFLSFKVTPSIEGAATFSASGSAIAGSHSLRVDSLAAGDRWAFDGVADPNAALATVDGQGVSFDYNGTTYTTTTTAATSSLNAIASQINSVTAGAVTASVVNAGTTTSPSWQLVVAAKDTGKDFRITNISSAIPALTIDGTGPDSAGVAQSTNNIVVGNNAVALVDGLRVERDNNDFSGVVEGVSISLLDADPTKTLSFTVAPDKDAIKGRLKDFVDAYNAVVKFIGDQNKFDAKAGPSGALFGDSALRTIQRTIQGVLFNQSVAQVTADTAGYGTLRLVGIETNPDGSLKINDTVLNAKMDGDLAAFTDLFVDRDGFNNGGAAIGTPGYYIDTTADTGLGDDLARALDQVVKSFTDSSGKSFDGLFDARVKALQSNIKSLDTQIDRGDAHIETYRAQLTARFAALEKLMAQLQSQTQYLNSSQSSSLGG